MRNIDEFVAATRLGIFRRDAAIDVSPRCGY